MRTLLAALTVLMLFATPVVAGDSDDAEAAYFAGNYEKAFRLLKPLAEQGDGWAQYTLGVLYDNGDGVPEDDAKAVYWYRKAAERGNAQAQSNLGMMYVTGEGVPQNYVQAYAWWSIAAAREHEAAKKNKGIIKKEMTREQIAKGQELAAELWEKYVVPFQND